MILNQIHQKKHQGKYKLHRLSHQFNSGARIFINSNFRKEDKVETLRQRNSMLLVTEKRQSASQSK